MNKREAQRQRKEQLQRTAEKRQRTRGALGKAALYGGLPAVLIAAAYVLLSQGPVYSPVELAADDHVRGDADNPVAVMVYADFQCSACAIESQNMNRIWSDIEDRAFLVFRHYPVTGRFAWTAALYAEAAGRQGKFWEMHNLLFFNQGLWSGLAEVEEEFDSYATELELDLEQLHADMASEAVIAKLRRDQRSGNRSGVRATPTVFVNGEQLASTTSERMRQAVDEAYAGLTEAAPATGAPEESAGDDNGSQDS